MELDELNRLQQLLEENRRFLQASCKSYDDGFEAEAKRIAVVLRVLLHDTAKSSSLLRQLRVKGKLAYFDSAEGINPANIISTPGLVVLYDPSGGTSQGPYYAPLDDLPGFRTTKRKPFNQWWTEAVTNAVGGGLWSRKDFVQALSNKEGGAHVDPKLSGRYDDLTRKNHMWVEFFDQDGNNVTPLETNIALASVRQIAHELHKTLSRPAYAYPRPPEDV